jgi:aminoglycoside phosphotransferase family enzyme/predicted kinase
MAVSIPPQSDMQERVFAFLSDPASHAEVLRIDTHGASVFLEGRRALKIKRAVRFPFLDYSTLEKRKAACEEEIRINRPFAPQIYHRVVPITQNKEGSFEIGGSGTPVEYAIEMTRFDERQTFDHLAAAGPLDPALIDAAAETIAACHTGAPIAAAEPWIGSIPGIIEGNSKAFREAACFPAEAIDDLERASFAAFSYLQGLLTQRGAQGFVRRCHGDLHLANIVLIDQKPVLFDAIEFDPLIATTDVLYDLAFAIMDFLKFGRPHEANALLNRYLLLAAVENLDGLATLPLFMSMRAAIRAHVMLARIKRNARDKVDMIRSVNAYFDLAQSAIHPPPPMLVAVGGLSGTGKSLLARTLAPAVLPEPGAVVIRTDVLRKQYFHISETGRLPEDAYRTEVNEKIYATLFQRASSILASGHSVIVDAVFARPFERDAIFEAARKRKVRFSGLFLTADLATRQQRVGRRERDASDATPEIAAIQENYEIGAIDWSLVDASGTPEETLQKCLAHIPRAGLR